MLSTKLICSIWFLLGIIPEIYSSEYLHFGGTEEENRQAEYYLSADSGANIDPADEVIRTQRSFWKLFKQGLFGNCGNCCNYNAGNENSIPSLFLPFQPLKPLRPMPLWRPLEPLFGRLNVHNDGAETYGDDSLNNCRNPPTYGVHTHSTDGTDNNVSPPPEPMHDVPTELPTLHADYQLDNVPIIQNVYEQSTKSGISAYRNHEIYKEPQHSNKNVPHIIYVPIIYVSPQYQGNIALHQHKPESYERENSKEFKQPLYSSHDDKTFEAVTTGVQTVSYNEIPAVSLRYTPAAPSAPALSTFYNIINHPYNDNVVTPSATGDPSIFASNYLPSDNYLLNTPASINYFPYPPPSTHTYAPMILTSDDQPYRVCPELFQDYQRKLNSLLPHI